MTDPQPGAADTPAIEDVADDLTDSDQTDSDPPAAEPIAIELARLGDPPGPIEATDPFGVAGRKAMWPQVERLLRREPVLRDPGEIDGLRRYRVATRRLRAALRVFGPGFSGKESKRLRIGLSTLANAVGAVRDLDVRLADLDRWATGADQTDLDGGQPDAVAGRWAVAAQPLRSTWAAERERAATALMRELDTRRHRRLLSELVSFVQVEDAAAGRGDRDRTVRDRAGSATWAAFEVVRPYGEILRWADLEELHDLRIAAKRLRYTLEFLAPVLGPERRWLIERLVALQDHLGALNDASVTVVAARSFLGERHATVPAEQRAGIARYLTDRELDLGRLRRGVSRAWRPIAGVTFARRLGRTVVVHPTGGAQAIARRQSRD